MPFDSPYTFAPSISSHSVSHGISGNEDFLVAVDSAKERQVE